MLLLIEGFEGAPSLAGGISAPMNTMLERKGHDIGDDLRSDAGRVAGVSAKTDDMEVALRYHTTDDTLIFGFGFKTDTWDVGKRTFAHLSHSTGTILLSLDTVNTDEWRVVLPDAGTYTTTNSSGGGFGWYYVECKIVFGDTGSFELKINGVTELSASGIDTNNNDKLSSWLRLKVPGDGKHWYDDVYVCDSTGSENNDFLGVCQVIALFPDGDGSSSDFTPSAGDNYENVDENPVDDDTTYNSGSHGAIDYYTYTASVDNNLIRGIQINTTVQATDAESMAVKSKIKSGASTEDGNTHYINVGYVTRYEIVLADPDTSSRWLEAGINAAEFGLEIV